MRVDRYELRDFGSHRHTVYEPGDARLCVIQGPNGLGKTTLVSEALGYALFRDFRGSVNGPVRIGQTDCSVTVELVLGADRYRAIRRRTTKGAGKSSADLQLRLADGTWSPVASGDKEVPAEVASLLHMDSATFRASVSLAQNDLRRFVAATSGDRKEILAAIVVDPRFAPAAELAGKRARDVAGRVEAERAQLDRLDGVIAELKPTRDDLEAARAAVAAAEQEIADGRSARNVASKRLQVVGEQLAAAAGIDAERERLETEQRELRDRWTAARDRRAGSVAALERANASLVDVDEVETAAAALEAARAAVTALEADEAADRRLATEISDAQVAFDAIDRPLADTITTWRTKRDDLAGRIRELEDHARAGTSVCEACGQAIEQATALEQLRAARERLHDLGDEPKAPLSLARASAALQRATSRRREVGWDPAAIAAARERLTALERLAARADGMEAARASVVRETAAIAEADADAGRIRTRGESIKTRLEELAAQAAATEPLRAERTALQKVVADADASIETGERQRRTAGDRAAAAAANVARLERSEAERIELAKSLKELQVRLERFRYLAGRFGLKGIPARVIEGVLPELGRHANDALQALFDMSLDIRATRSSADGKTTIEALDLVVCKEGTGEIEFARTSGGQGTAIALAMALGLARLNARRAGTPIRTWIVDEPEGLDVERLKRLGAYLRDLVQTGELERVFLITHTTELAEFGDRVDEVLEGPDGVELRQVA